MYYNYNLRALEQWHVQMTNMFHLKKICRISLAEIWGITFDFFCGFSALCHRFSRGLAPINRDNPCSSCPIQFLQQEVTCYNSPPPPPMRQIYSPTSEKSALYTSADAQIPIEKHGTCFTYGLWCRICVVF